MSEVDTGFSLTTKFAIGGVVIIFILLAIIWFIWPSKGSYEFHKQMDSQGSDLGKLHGLGSDQLKLVCDATSKCSGFTTDGMLKSSIRPEREWNRVADKSFGLFVKQ